MTLVQMVDNGLGITLLPQMAVRGLLKGTSLATRRLSGRCAGARDCASVWRKGAEARRVRNCSAASSRR